MTRALFEVKTNSSTQAVYTGTGQLAFYNLGAKAKSKVLVLPLDGEEWRSQLNILGVQLWTYEIKGKSVLFRPPPKEAEDELIGSYPVR